MSTVATDLVARLQQAVGADIVHGPDEADFARHRADFQYRMEDAVSLLGVAYPRTTDQVSKILAICNEEGVPVIPQGGLTGFAGGAVAIVPSLILSLERMRAIEELDPIGRTITVGAGVALETVQQAADEAGFFFPLDLGARGSAQVGGNAATNAGGNRVLRYGMMRESILGLEAVLADGTVISAMNVMLKNNAGYDLKHLFIGSEGTLGIITRLVLRLFPKPTSVSTGLLAVADVDAALALLREVNSAFAGSLSAFEVMWPEFYTLGTDALSRRPPLQHGYGVYILIETLGTEPDRDTERFEEVIGGLIEKGLVEDAVIAQSEGQRLELWGIRDVPGEFPKVFWPQISFDVSLPATKMASFVPAVRAAMEARWPGSQTLFFGHIADSNLHISIKVPEEPLPIHAIDELVYAEVGRVGGSVSAEHGIGLLKRDYLHHSRTPAELALMRHLKASLDPKGILNPGKVI
jgi:FAD/FMN-containing dehydrogenase